MKFAARRTTPALPSHSRSPWGWAVAGLLCGSLLATLVWAPARWLAQAVASLTHEQVLLAQAQGTVWNGSATLVLSAGQGAADASLLPQRLSWALRPTLRGLRLDLSHPGHLNAVQSLEVQLGWQKLRLSVPDAQPWLGQWPAALLTGLGTPWNTLQLQGQLQLSTQQFALERVAGRWQLQGQLNLELLNIASRVSTLAPLGSYRLQLTGDGQGGGQLQLSTLGGALLLNGQGQVGERLQFQGEASAAPGTEAVLANVLNIIGRRQGARSVISVG
ncbi:type II secretion system protein N [Roseateles sp. BYS180W]|uniref:Type II secretion system protein N n=1 Tax=Roseateles rivi TaxID=3299028 RepID=A0ABW7FRB6_9BURK